MLRLYKCDINCKLPNNLSEFSTVLISFDLYIVYLHLGRMPHVMFVLFSQAKILYISNGLPVS